MYIATIATKNNPKWWCQVSFLIGNDIKWFEKVSWATSKVNEVNADTAIYYFSSLRKCFLGCEQPLFPPGFFWVRTPPIYLEKVSWAPNKVNEVNADTATYYFISLRKCFLGCKQPLFPPGFFWVRTPPLFFKRSLGLQAKSMKSMPIRQHTISSVSENVP